MKLFMFYIGGGAGKSNIELHDIQFAAVEQAEQAFPLLRESWFGDKHRIHVDGYQTIDWADGYDVSLSTVPYTGQARLYFVNMGGYRPDSLAELHEFDLFVAPNAQEVKLKAKARLLKGSNQQHKDDLAEVDDCLLLTTVGGYHIHLRENPRGVAAKPLWQGYMPIGE